MKVTLPGSAAEVIASSKLKKEYPDTWRSYLNQRISVTKSGHYRVSVDLTPNQLMQVVRCLEDTEMVTKCARLDAERAVSVIYQKIRDHRGEVATPSRIV